MGIERLEGGSVCRLWTSSSSWVSGRLSVTPSAVRFESHEASFEMPALDDWRWKLRDVSVGPLALLPMSLECDVRVDGRDAPQTFTIPDESSSAFRALWNSWR